MARPSLELLDARCAPAVFFAATAGELIGHINTANANGDDDVIELTADITLTAVDNTNTTTGDNGLPVIGPDGGFALKINGNGFTLARDTSAADFRLIEVAAGADLTLDTITLTGGAALGAGSAGGGGAIRNNSGTLDIRASTITGNIAHSGGGLINYGTATLTASTFHGNTGQFNAGAIANAGTALIVNSTISNNTAQILFGGGIANFDPAVLTIINSTITGNRADGSTVGLGGGLFAGGTVTLFNTIVAGNFGADRGATLEDVVGTVDSSSANNLIGVDTFLTGITNGANGNQVGTALAPLDPMLGALADNGGPTQTHALLAGSTALDAGDNNAASGLDADQRGFQPRIVNGRVDIGAVEIGAQPPPPDDVVHLIAVGAAAGGGPHVKVFNADGSLRFSFFAYDAAFTGGVRVAVGDVNGDRVDDIITAAGPGAGPHVKVFDGVTGQEIRSFFAFEPQFTGGVFVAAGEINGDSFADIIVGAGAGGGPHVKVFSGQDGSVLRSFFAYSPQFTGGVRVAAGDVDGDTVDDIITAAGPGGGPHVQVFSGRDNAVLASFFAFQSTFPGGVFVAAGDVDGDRLADVIAGNSAGQLNIFDGASGRQRDTFRAFDEAITSATRPAVLDLDGDDVAEILVGRGKRTPPEVRVFDGLTLDEIDSFFAFEPGFTGGVFVG